MVNASFALACRFLSLASRQDFDHGDRGLDNVRLFASSQSHRLPFRACFAGRIALASRLREDLDCPALQVDDPEHGNAGLGVPRELDSSIEAIWLTGRPRRAGRCPPAAGLDGCRSACGDRGIRRRREGASSHRTRRRTRERRTEWSLSKTAANSSTRFSTVFRCSGLSVISTSLPPTSSTFISWKQPAREASLNRSVVQRGDLTLTVSAPLAAKSGGTARPVPKVSQR